MWVKRITGKMQKLSYKVFILILACVVLPVFLVFFLVKSGYEQYIQQQISQQIISSIAKSEEGVYGIFRNMAGTSSSIVTNTRLLEGLRSNTLSYYDIYRRFDDCVNYTRINNLYGVEDMFITLFDASKRIYANWGINFHDYSFILEESWIKESVAMKGHITWSMFTPAFIMAQTQSEDRYISLSRAIMDDLDTQRSLGVVIISIPQADLSRLLTQYSFNENDSVFVCTEDGNILLRHGPGDVGEPSVRDVFARIGSKTSGSTVEQIAAGAKLVSFYTLSSPWTFGDQKLQVLHFTDYQPVLDRMSALAGRMNLILLLSVLAVIMVVAFIAHAIVSPVQTLARHMQGYTLGTALHGVNMERRDEIGHLNRSFRNLTGNLQEMFLRLEEEYAVKEKYRYESLRAQLNPHFLFNTLNTIRLMALMRHADNIAGSIDSLTIMLNYSMGRGGELVRLSDEISNVKSYIYIQNLRYGEQLTVETDFEEEVLQLYTLRFLLQPIVENAVIHGLKENKAQGKPSVIRLYGHVEERELHLFVEDNGSGMPAQIAEQINRPAEQTHRDANKFTGIGLSHVNDMIRMTFGKQYGLHISSTPGIGSVVSYTLPMIEHCEEEAREENTDRG